MRHSVKLLSAVAITTLLTQPTQSLGVSQEPGVLSIQSTQSFLRNVASIDQKETLQLVAGGAVPIRRILDEDTPQEREEQLRRDKERLEEQLESCINQSSCIDQADIVTELSNVYFELSEYQKTIDLLSRQLRAARENGDAQLEQSLLDGIQGNLNQNWEFQAAYGIVKNRHLRDLYGRGDLSWQKVIEISEVNLFAAHSINDIEHEIDSLHGLGWAYRNIASYPNSLILYENALSLIEDAVSRSDIKDQNLNFLFRKQFITTEIGIVYTDLGQYDQALAHLQESLDIAFDLYEDQPGYDMFLGFTLTRIGDTYLRMGKHSEALLFFEDARENYFPTFDRHILSIGLSLIYSSSGRYYEAIEALESVKDRPPSIAEPGGLGFVLSFLGELQTLTGEYNQSLENLRSALAIFEKLNEPFGESQTLGKMAALAETQNETQLAIILYKESVNVLEAIRANLVDLPVSARRSYTESVSETYRRLADLLLQEDRIIEAQRVLDLLKVQELDDYIRGIERTSETETGVDFLRPEETILARYDAFQQSAIAAGQELDELKDIPAAQRSDEQVQRIAQLTDLLDDINGDFRDFASSPEIRELIDQLSYEARDASLSLNQLDRLRDELQQLNAAIFYPLILDDRLELLITVPDSPPLRRTVQVSREELNAAILTFRTALTSPSSDVETPAQQLYDWLIRPLEADLVAAGVETIIYSPDGQLRYIPLAALHDGDNWLIQQYRINNITAESLTDLTESDPTQPTILAAAYADPFLIHEPEVNGTPYRFQGLPGAGAEVATLPTATKFLDQAFSLETLRPLMDEYSILHFATHAAFVPGVPEDSFILFGNGDTPTLRDVANWSLNGVDLVVLSACETGMGGLGNGEEILGLGYQFQVSGAKAVMSSLWKVSDRGTQSLMTEFYAALNQGLTKAAALQAAQRSMIAHNNSVSDEDDPRAGAPPMSRDGGAIASNYPGYSHPYYWAPFILIGNGL